MLYTSDSDEGDAIAERVKSSKEASTSVHPAAASSSGQQQAEAARDEFDQLAEEAAEQSQYVEEEDWSWGRSSIGREEAGGEQAEKEVEVGPNIEQETIETRGILQYFKPITKRNAKCLQAFEFESGIAEEELVTFFDLYQIPTNYKLSAAKKLRACSEPLDGEGRVIILYEGSFRNGMRVPFSPFIVELCEHYGISPSQMIPAAWKIVNGFLISWVRACRRENRWVEPNVFAFRSLATIKTYSNPHFKIKTHWVTFTTRPGMKFTKGEGKAQKDWEWRFFAIFNPSGSWPVLNTWSLQGKTDWTNLNKPKKGETPLTDDHKFIIQLLKSEEWVKAAVVGDASTMEDLEASHPNTIEAFRLSLAQPGSPQPTIPQEQPEHEQVQPGLDQPDQEQPDLGYDS